MRGKHDGDWKCPCGKWHRRRSIACRDCWRIRPLRYKSRKTLRIREAEYRNQAILRKYDPADASGQRA